MVPIGTIMGVHHGRGGKSLQNLEWGTLMQILQILSYRYKKERSVAFEIHQNPFPAGDLPLTPPGELITLPRPSSWLGGDTPTHTPPHSASIYRRRLPYIPQNASQIYDYSHRGDC